MCGASSAGCLPAAACWHRMCQLRAGKIWICLLPGSAPLHGRFFQLSAWNAEPELPQGGQNLGKGLRQILQLRTRTAVTAPGVLCADSWQGLQTVFLSFYSFSKQTHLISSCLFLSPARKKKKETKKNERVLNLLFDGTKLGTENKDIWLYPEVPLYFLNT